MVWSLPWLLRLSIGQQTGSNELRHLPNVIAPQLRKLSLFGITTDLLPFASSFALKFNELIYLELRTSGDRDSDHQPTLILESALREGRWPQLCQLYLDFARIDCPDLVDIVAAGLTTRQIRLFLRSAGNVALKMFCASCGSKAQQSGQTGTAVRRHGHVVVRDQLLRLELGLADDSVFDGMFFPQLRLLELKGVNDMSSLDCAACACPNVRLLTLGGVLQQPGFATSSSQRWSNVEFLDLSLAAQFWENDNVGWLASRFTPLSISLNIPQEVVSTEHTLKSLRRLRSRSLNKLRRLRFVPPRDGAVDIDLLKLLLIQLSFGSGSKLFRVEVPTLNEQRSAELKQFFMDVFGAVLCNNIAFFRPRPPRCPLMRDSM